MTGGVLKTSANTGRHPVSSYLTFLLLYVITCLDKDLSFLHPRLTHLCPHPLMPWFPNFWSRDLEYKRALSFLKLHPELALGIAGLHSTYSW